MVVGSTVRLRHLLGRRPLIYTCVRQQGAAFSAFEPTLTTTIASTTFATPIEVMTSASHNLSSGDRVIVSGHHVNTAANGTWSITVTGVATFRLDNSVGIAVGGATGNVVAVGLNPKEVIVLRSNATGVFDLLVL